MYYKIKMLNGLNISGRSSNDGVSWVNFHAHIHLLLIHEAWNAGLDLEDLADGYGKGDGTYGDWSGIRDSSTEAKTLMFERSLNFICEKMGTQEPKPSYEVPLPGEMVKVFEDPLTCTKLEGEAELLRIIGGGNSPGLCECDVRFDDGDYRREINLNNFKTE